MSARYQDLSLFRMPKGFRGRSGGYVQLWWFVQAVLFHPSPQVMYRWRAFLLRTFGAKVGRDVIIRPSVIVTYPWKVTIGDFAWIGDNVTLYSLGEIVIGSHTVVSQGSYLCAGSHDPTVLSFPITNQPIHIGNECWIASGVFICPGVTLGNGAIIGARSTVTRPLPEAAIAAGSPAKCLGYRSPSAQSSG